MPQGAADIAIEGCDPWHTHSCCDPCIALRDVHPVWTLQPSIRRPVQEFNPGAKVPSTNTGSWAHRPLDATQGSLPRRGQETRRTLSPSQQHKKPRPSVNGGKLRRAPDHNFLPTPTIVSIYLLRREKPAPTSIFSAASDKTVSAGPQHTSSSI